MYYTLKCNPAQSPACGEWDYLTNTYLYKQTGVFDSVKYTHPNYIVGGITPDSLLCMNTNSWKYLPWLEYSNFTYPLSIHRVGDSTTGLPVPFGSDARDARSQYIWKAQELLASGLTAGQITGMKFRVMATGNKLKKLAVRIKSTTLTALSDSVYARDGFTEVFRRDWSFGSPGWESIPFSFPFTWDGVSNLIADISFQDQLPYPGVATDIFSGPAGFDAGITAKNKDLFLRFHGTEYLNIPAAVFDNIDSAITISFWQYGDPQLQPRDNTILEGINSLGQRVINIHLPWSNSNVYWDAGRDSLNYDRVSQPAPASAFKGKWNHWAFTKDVKTQRMRIYLNGNLFFNQGNKKRLMSGIVKFNLGCPGSADGWFYQGNIDEFCVWNKALSDTAIRASMYRDITPSNPDYTHLIAYYKFNEGSGLTTADSSGFARQPAIFYGYPEWQSYQGKDRFRNFEQLNYRPSVAFEQGVYNPSSLDSTLRIDTVANPPFMVTVFGDSLHPINPTDTLTKYPGYYYNYVFNAGGKATDSTLFPPDTIIRRKDWTYYGKPYEILERFELGRYITPYGNNLSLGNGWTWIYDFTDYASLLHDSVRLSAGNWQELMDMKFAFIEGIPPRDILGIYNVYTGNHGYADSTQHNLPPVKIRMQPDVKEARLKMRITGHGFGGTDNCSEFCPRLNTLKVNGVQAYTHYVWRPDCGMNPLYPQGGTWLYDRANWCPGAEVWTKDFELGKYVSPGDTLTVDYDLQPGYRWNGAGSWPYYQIESQLVTYGEKNFRLDASVEQIYSPNRDQFFNRWNPMCSDPVIVIKNNGSDTLRSAVISYRPAGAVPQIYRWQGRLGFSDTARISMPPVRWDGWWGGDNRFIVSVDSANGRPDDYLLNNMMSSGFSLPPTYDNEFVFHFKTNHLADSLSWTLEDWEGNIIDHNGPLVNNSLYIDTIRLEKGCYRLSIRNSTGEGLSYWANMPPYGNGTSGYARIKDMSGKIIKAFQGDFGRMISQSFTVGMSISTEEHEKTDGLIIYPNPSRGKVSLSMRFSGNSKLPVRIHNALGRQVWFGEFDPSAGNVMHCDLSGLPAGAYAVNLDLPGGRISRKLILLAD
jgi:hypothetical protein